MSLRKRSAARAPPDRGHGRGTDADRGRHAGGSGAAIFDFAEGARIPSRRRQPSSAATSIQIVNDDADLLHHAYVDSDKFSFDSGDQKPGSVTPITFPVAGDFDVLCAIHPKMRLVVHVQ